MPRDVFEGDIEIFGPNDIVSVDITTEAMGNGIYSLFFEGIPAFPYKIFLDVEKNGKRQINLRVETELPKEELENVGLRDFNNLHIGNIVGIDLPNFKPFLDIKQRGFIEKVLEKLLGDGGFDDGTIDNTKGLVTELI